LPVPAAPTAGPEGFRNRSLDEPRAAYDLLS
jgi:hypothetical protein